MKTVSLELAKQLKEAGFPQETIFYWSKPTDSLGRVSGKYHIVYQDPDNGKCESCDHKYVAAPTVEEILERLPENTTAFRTDKNGLWTCRIHTYGDGHILYDSYDEYGKSLAEAAGKMWLYLKENNL